MTKRATLANLGDRLAKKGPEAAAIAAPEAARSTPRANRQPDGRKGILVRARPEAWKALKYVALEREITLQDLMIEAINETLQKHGKPPVA